MDSSKLITYMIIGCLIFMLLIAISKPLKNVFKIIVQGIIGSFGFLIVNTILSGFNIFVGINFLTAFIVGVLGIPGFICLYIVNAII